MAREHSRIRDIHHAWDAKRTPNARVHRLEQAWSHDLERLAILVFVEGLEKILLLLVVHTEATGLEDLLHVLTVIVADVGANTHGGRSKDDDGHVKAATDGQVEVGTGTFASFLIVTQLLELVVQCPVGIELSAGVLAGLDGISIVTPFFLVGDVEVGLKVRFERAQEVDVAVGLEDTVTPESHSEKESAAAQETARAFCTHLLDWYWRRSLEKGLGQLQ